MRSLSQHVRILIFNSSRSFHWREPWWSHSLCRSPPGRPSRMCGPPPCLSWHLEEGHAPSTWLLPATCSQISVSICEKGTFVSFTDPTRCSPHWCLVVTKLRSCHTRSCSRCFTYSSLCGLEKERHFLYLNKSRTLRQNSKEEGTRTFLKTNSLISFLPGKKRYKFKTKQQAL